MDIVRFVDRIGVLNPIATAVQLSDTFTRTLAAGDWGNVEVGGLPWTESTAASFSVNGSRGLVSLAAVDSSRRGSVTLPLVDPDVVASFRVPVTATGASINAGVMGRHQDGSNFYVAELRVLTDSSLVVRLGRFVADSFATLNESAPLALTHLTSRVYRLRFQLRGPTLRARAWDSAGAEPTTWNVEATDETFTTGNTGVRCVLTAGNTNTLPVAIEYDDFVAATSGTDTQTRLDLNDGDVWGVNYEGTDLSPPPLKSAFTGTLLADGERMSASAYANRTIELSMDLMASTPDLMAAELQKLWRELNRPFNVLMWQPEGATNPVFFRTIRSSNTRVTDYPSGELRSVRVSIDAEPFAYGLKEQQAAVTVTNDPAASVNPMYFDVPSPKGDVETPLYMAIDGASIIEATPMDGFALSVSNGWGTANNNRPWTTTGGSASNYFTTLATGSAGVQRQDSVGVIRSSLLETGSTDFDYSVDVSFPVTAPTGNAIAVWAMGRVADVSNYYAASVNLATTGAVTLQLSKREAGALRSLGSSVAAGSNTANDLWRIRFSGKGGALSATLQNITAGGPLFSTPIAIDGSLLSGTQIGVQSRLETGNTNALPVDIAFDTLTPAKLGRRMSMVAVRRRGTPANTPFVLQAESMTLLDASWSRRDTGQMSGSAPTLNANPTFETNVLNWTANFCTLTRDTTQFAGGIASMKLVPAGGVPQAYAESEKVTIDPSKRYAAGAWIRCDATRVVAVTINWYTSADVYISTSTASGLPTVPAAAWTYVGAATDGVPPANAAKATMNIVLASTPLTTHVTYIDMAEIGEANFAKVPTGTIGAMTSALQSAVYPAIGSVDARGTYRVFMRYRYTTNGTAKEISARLRWADIYNDAVTLSHYDTEIHFADLGLVQIPGGYDPVSDGVSGSEIPAEGIFMQLQVGDSAGFNTTSDLDVDYFMFAPADDRLLLIRWPNRVNARVPTDMLIDSRAGQVYARNASGQAGSVPGTELVGGPPLISPGVTNRVYFAADVGVESFPLSKFGTTLVTTYYWPRYLTVRPAST